MIWVTNRSGDLTYICPEWHVLTGQTETGALGRGWLAAVLMDDRSMVSGIFRKALETRASFTLRFRVLSPGNDVVWIASAAEPSRDPFTDEFLGYLGTAVERPAEPLIQASYAIAINDQRSGEDITVSSRWQMLISHLSAARALIDDGRTSQARTRIDEALQLIEVHLSQIED